MTGDFGRPTRPPTALEKEAVEEGMAFVTWRFGVADSRREGTFASGVYTSTDPDYNESLVVDVTWGDGRTTTEVASSLGLCHNRHTGDYEDAASILNDGEGE